MNNTSFWEYHHLLHDYELYEYIDGYAKDKILFEASRLTVGFLTILFNFILVSCFCREKGLPERTATKRLLFSLSLCDLVTGFYVTAHAASVYWQQVIHFEGLTILDIFRLFLTKAYVMHLSGLALDRFMSIFCALRYKEIVTQTTITCYIVVTWCFPLIFSTIRVVWLLQCENTGTCYWYWYSAVGFVVFLAIPMVLLAIAFAKMFCEIRRILKSPPAGYCIGAVRRVRKELRVISTFSFMYVTFLIVAMPYFIFRFWLDICTWYELEYSIDQNVRRVIVVMKDVTSLLNPICYTIITPEVRKTCKESFTRFTFHRRSKRKKLLLKKLEMSDRSTEANHSSYIKKKDTSFAEIDV